MLTPGVSVSRSSNFLPKMGVCEIVMLFSVSLDSVAVTSILAVLFTVTVSPATETFMVKFKLLA